MGHVICPDYYAGVFIHNPFVNPRITCMEAEFRVHRQTEKHTVQLIDHTAMGDNGYGVAPIIF